MTRIEYLENEIKRESSILEGLKNGQLDKTGQGLAQIQVARFEIQRIKFRLIDYKEELGNLKEQLSYT
jgi:hypothetical protein